MGISTDILKLGFSHPLPTGLTLDFLKNHETVIVVEELEPIIETSVRAVAQQHSCGVRILGKTDGLFPRAHEFDQSVVARGLSKAFGGINPYEGKRASTSEDLPARPPILCAGCPHSARFFAVTKAIGKDVIFASDIGCYTLGVAPPFNAADILVCMGSSVGTAGGLAKVNQKPVIAFIGDSTFFHAGIPGLVNAVHHGHKFLLMILDNRTTAMTGHQPHPGSDTGPSCCDITAVSIEDLVKGCGVKWLKVVDPYDMKTTTEAVKEALEQDSVSVIVARRECALIARRDEKGAITRKQAVDQDLCKKCRTCVDRFRCPAITSKDNVQYIDLALCSGCEVCADVCPHKAIRGAD